MAKYKCKSDDYSFYKKGVCYDGEVAEFSSTVATLAKRFPGDWELIPEFKKGEEILVSDSGKIWRERIFHGMYNNKYVDCDFKIWNQAKKKPLLVTEDGVELFNEGDIVHYSNEDIKDKCDTTVVKLASELPECTKFFSTLEARQSYIDSLEPRYVPFTKEDHGTFTSKIVIEKENKTYYYVNTWDCNRVQTGGIWISYERALISLEFVDGSPFGKKVK